MKEVTVRWFVAALCNLQKKTILDNIFFPPCNNTIESVFETTKTKQQQKVYFWGFIDKREECKDYTFCEAVG